MVSARALARHFGSFVAVDSIDFRIPRGQVVGFLGPNGAGKTTTIRMIAGILPPSTGEVTVDGLDAIRHGKAVRERIGYLQEFCPLYGEMRVHEFLRFRARLQGVPRARRRAAIDLAMRRGNLAGVARRPIQHLSRGYRQRVGLAAALVHEPPLIILDEPTVGLDPSQVVEFRRLIRELAGRHTILLSTHILPEVELVCDRVLLMACGRVWADGSLDDLRRQGQTESVVHVEMSTADAAKAEPALRALVSVESILGIELTDGWRRLEVRPRMGAGDLRHPIARTLADLGCVPRELHLRTASLEELFVRAVARAESGAEAQRLVREAS